MNTTSETIKRIAAELRTLFPYGHSVSLLVNADTTPPELVINGTFDYAEGSEMLRQHGLHVRQKEVYDSDPTFKWTKISAEVDGVIFKALANGLPPTCRIVKEKVRIPKTQIVDTGEFIEIEKERVVCGNDDNCTRKI